jgi:hypothetical protein
MKKFSVLIALALLAVAGTGYAVTCAYDNVPAATLLVPHFRVARNGSTGGDIPEGGVDTLCAVTNVSSTALIVHVTVWNKYSKAVLDFNVPLTAWDVAFWRMKDILNGHLNVNPNAEDLDSHGNPTVDVCGQTPGWGQYSFIRFNNPSPSDAAISISIYNDPAFTGTFRTQVWDSLDETKDITGFTPYPSGTIDLDNPACGSSTNSAYTDDFGGYLTLDVVNYCTNYFPDESLFYQNDAIATNGWLQSGYTPNAIIGDIFYVDPAATGGNVSGDPMVPLEYDFRLNDWVANATFFGRYRGLVDSGLLNAPYNFIGDGREPLGHHYGFRYLADPANGLTSWAIIWRSDNYTGTTTTNLCGWWAANSTAKQTTNTGLGIDPSNIHIITASTFDNDENVKTTSGGPSGGPTASSQYVFLESQRIAIGGNADINPGGFPSGWIDIDLTGTTVAGIRRNQAYVGIQHAGPGLAISVGHSAANLDEQFNCSPQFFTQVGNQP